VRVTSLRARFKESVELLAACRDLLEDRPARALTTERPQDPHVRAVAARGWQDALLGLTEHELDALEAGGLDAPWPPSAPASLTEVLSRARASCALPLLTSAPHESTPARRHETPRKQAQVDAFARLLTPVLRDARRVLDVGSGHGHLTRALASRLAQQSRAIEVVGLERDAALTARARALADTHGLAQAVTFARADVVKEGLALAAGDCVVGLHACGELGDALVQEGARARAHVVLVGCCLQKRRAVERAPLSQGAHAQPRALLGLSNLTLRDDGVEASRADNLAARARRLALSRLLADAGAPVAFGAELSGLNRRAAHQQLGDLVQRVFALRGLPLPSARAIEDAQAWALREHARVRRLQLPRTMLARALEVHVALDRASFLEARGFQVNVGLAFAPEVSARNLAIVARATA
jgi:protein-L-isoaspartate O-methyltransferase